VGDDAVQLLRTYPAQRPAYPFAPQGERTVARGYMKALSRAETFVYVEDQYLWSSTVAAQFAEALRRSPQLRLVAVLPRFSDAEGGLVEPASDVARAEAIALLRQAGGDRVHIFDLENDRETPIYVHAKICVIDDVWAAVGSANLNRRSWTHDSELTAAVVTEGPGESFARRLRVRLWAEHLGRAPRAPAELADLADPAGGVEILPLPHDPLQARALEPFIRVVADPDRRPWTWRRDGRW